MTFAMVFPGQGSQSVGMLASLAANHACVQETIDEASEIVGVDLWSLSQNGESSDLADTRVTQPLMFAAGVAVWRVLVESGVEKPCAYAGHSLGEFSAMVAAGCLPYSAGVSLVKRRSELMANAVAEGEGGMAALIGMDDQAVIDLCQSITGDRITEAVNFNAPGQVAISGHLDALQRTVEAAREKGCRKALMLPVSVPNHSSLMRPAGEELAKAMDDIDWQAPHAPVVQNATAQSPETPDQLLGHLKAHVYKPVYWTRCVETLRDVHGASTIVEVGPGKVLSGLGRRIDRKLPTLPVESPETLHTVLEALA